MLTRLRDMRIRQQLKKEISADSKDWENIYLGSGGAERNFDRLSRKSRTGKVAGQASVGNCRSREQRSAGRAFRFDRRRSRPDRRDLFHDERRRHARRDEVAVRQLLHRQRRARDGWSAFRRPKSHPRGWGSYPRILGRYVRDEKLMSLETAIHKMTGMPATKVGLKQTRIAARRIVCRHHDLRSEDRD